MTLDGTLDGDMNKECTRLPCPEGLFHLRYSDTHGTCLFSPLYLQSCHVQDCLVLKGFSYHVACTVLSDVSCPVGNVSPILLPVDHVYHVQDCLVLKAFSHRLISGTAVYESWTFVSVDHLYHEVTDRV